MGKDSSSSNSIFPSSPVELELKKQERNPLKVNHKLVKLAVLAALKSSRKIKTKQKRFINRRNYSQVSKHKTKKEQNSNSNPVVAEDSSLWLDSQNAQNDQKNHVKRRKGQKWTNSVSSVSTTTTTTTTTHDPTAAACKKDEIKEEEKNRNHLSFKLNLFQNLQNQKPTPLKSKSTTISNTSLKSPQLFPFPLLRHEDGDFNFKSDYTVSVFWGPVVDTKASAKEMVIIPPVDEDFHTNSNADHVEGEHEHRLSIITQESFEVEGKPNNSYKARRKKCLKKCCGCLCKDKPIQRSDYYTRLNPNRRSSETADFIEHCLAKTSDELEDLKSSVNGTNVKNQIKCQQQLEKTYKTFEAAIRLLHRINLSCGDAMKCLSYYFEDDLNAEKMKLVENKSVLGSYMWVITLILKTVLSASDMDDQAEDFDETKRILEDIVGQSFLIWRAVTHVVNAFIECRMKAEIALSKHVDPYDPELTSTVKLMIDPDPPQQQQEQPQQQERQEQQSGKNTKPAPAAPSPSKTIPDSTTLKAPSVTNTVKKSSSNSKLGKGVLQKGTVSSSTNIPDPPASQSSTKLASARKGKGKGTKPRSEKKEVPKPPVVPAPAPTPKITSKPSKVQIKENQERLKKLKAERLLRIAQLKIHNKIGGNSEIEPPILEDTHIPPTPRLMVVRGVVDHPNVWSQFISTKTGDQLFTLNQLCRRVILMFDEILNALRVMDRYLHLYWQNDESQSNLVQPCFVKATAVLTADLKRLWKQKNHMSTAERVAIVECGKLLADELDLTEFFTMTLRGLVHESRHAIHVTYEYVRLYYHCGLPRYEVISPADNETGSSCSCKQTNNYKDKEFKAIDYRNAVYLFNTSRYLQILQTFPIRGEGRYMFMLQPLAESARHLFQKSHAAIRFKAKKSALKNLGGRKKK